MQLFILQLLLLFFGVVVIRAQQPPQQVTVPLNDSIIHNAAIGSGDLQHYYFSAGSTSLFDRRRSLARRDVPNLFLTLTTCSQPTPPPNYEGDIPSLDVFVSISNDNTLPGPSQGLLVNNTKFGRVAWENDNPLNDLWIGVVAPTLTENWNGNWTFEIAVSTEEWVHPLLLDQNNIPYMTLDDTDQTHALFTIDPPSNAQQHNSSILIVSNIPKQLLFSRCAANSYRVADYATNFTDTKRGHQALVSNLTAATQYTAYYIESTNAISIPIRMHTKRGANCRLVYNLGFCDQVAYSVAANPNDATDSIQTQYDDHAQELFQPFATAIMQYNCDSTKYSLVRNCTDCYNDYKRWLCSVTIPRCTDSIEDTTEPTINAGGGQMALRQIEVNHSRNPWIDETLAPGTYTELLPCIDLCYQVVQSCPPFMEFACPKGDLAALQYGYWFKSVVSGQQEDDYFNDSLAVYGVNHPTCNPVGLEETRLVISEGASLLLFPRNPITSFIMAIFVLFVSLFL
ncbi:stretch-activated Ca2+-permeable channel component-domain-containing protein [Phascolomyces articulosus]|uniref:Stretch-activated Ca2+-permeable channel component-domain-containing protein n=1 Tax=Phascolomyces articulosus TaxID=60185 RepID=A0AAD5PB13_9FUNG|nr:stretch-activated Ca2+-permeable channel component-domain-containing protein [Phascolomyces articulosus]